MLRRVHVYGWAYSTGPYALHIEMAEGCVDDAFEENDTRMTAAPLPGDSVDAALCPDDADFFVFDKKAGEAITATLPDPAQAGMQLRLVRPF